MLETKRRAALAAAALENTVSNLERAALDNGSVSVELRGRRVRAIAHAQRDAGRSVRAVHWELDGAGISRANLVTALSGRAE